MQRARTSSWHEKRSAQKELLSAHKKELKIANICEKIRKTKIHIFYQTSAAKPCYRSSFSVQMIDGESPNDENHAIGP